MHRNKWIIFLLFIILGAGCIEPFEPEIEETGIALVVDGRITDEPGIQTIYISRSSPYNTPRFLPVSGCVVRMEDASGKSMLFPETESGVYQSVPEPGFLTVGNAFKLVIITADDKMYESEYDSLLACAPIDKLTWKLEEQGTSDPEKFFYGVRFYADVKGDAEESRNYMWTFEETWEYLAYHKLQYIWDGATYSDYSPELHGYKVCYLTESISQMAVGSSSLMGTNEIVQQPLYFVSNQTPRLQEKYSLLVLQHSLTRGAFQYWDKMKAQSDDAGGLFETQPVSSTGNICNVDDPEEKVLGYFFVTQVQKKRIMVSEDFEFPIATFECPLDTAVTLEDFGVDYPYLMYSLPGRGPPWAYSYRECHDCTYRGGVTKKPEYWDD
jgi:hypothetical protein